MAVQQVGNSAGVAAVNAGGVDNKTNVNGGASGAPMAGHWDTDYPTITALRARLAAIDAGYYTSDRLNAMTMNDMVYAVRVNDSPSTIK